MNERLNKKVVLLTNDDGIKAKGLLTLYNTLKNDGRFDVHIVAPENERSAVGHAITVFDPISVKKEYNNGDFYGYAVNGTPADCVKLAVSAILDRKPDILISGINRGPNLGGNIIYSGTVSAATEGTMYNISSIAVSIDNLKDTDYSYAAEFAKKIAALIIEKGGLPEGTLLNINIPDIHPSNIRGVKITCQSDSKLKDFFIKRVDPRGRDCYWMDGEFVEVCRREDDDYSAIKNGYISITPIHYDLTDYEKIDYFRNWGITKDI
ncbi:MAG: 5'/3'-nucleotidase SurE [Actinobacteria bacterium]|nr:5'/3'-nucleotidase SurE [Actinomycetota bacterium]